jgi:hypothetical protein
MKKARGPFNGEGEVQWSEGEDGKIGAKEKKGQGLASRGDRLLFENRPPLKEPAAEADRKKKKACEKPLAPRVPSAHAQKK